MVGTRIYMRGRHPIGRATGCLFCTYISGSLPFVRNTDYEVPCKMSLSGCEWGKPESTYRTGIQQQGGPLDARPTHRFWFPHFTSQKGHFTWTLIICIPNEGSEDRNVAHLRSVYNFLNEINKISTYITLQSFKHVFNLVFFAVF